MSKWFCLFSLLCYAPFGMAASKLEANIKVQQNIQHERATSQTKIDDISAQSTLLLQEYRQVLDELQTLNVYNGQLKKLVKSQETQKVKRRSQLDGIEHTEQSIVPLMLNMITTLERFIGLDMPFLSTERLQRLQTLKQVMDLADVNTAEKYRQILEAFLVEMDYGKTIETYQAKNPEKATAVVDFLRIGRLALFYQTLDGQHSFVWSQANQRFDALPRRFKPSLDRGFRIARKQAAPEFLTLPMPAPEQP